jgi:hypothetical protein
MFLRLVRFKLSDSGRPLAQDMANDLVSAIKQQPGCASAVFFGGDDGESGLAVLWDTQEHADAAAGVISPKLMQHLAGNVVGEPDRRLFRVLAS